MVRLSFFFIVGCIETIFAFLGAGQQGISSSAVTMSGKTVLPAATTTTSDEVDEILPGGMIYDKEDEAELLSKSTFPIAPNDLIRRCKDVIVAQTGIQDDTNFDESIYVDDFKFVAPFVGGSTIPSSSTGTSEVEGLNKEAYLKSFRSFRDFVKSYILYLIFSSSRTVPCLS